MTSFNLVILQGSLTRPDLGREMRYLEKLLYKNNNQHKKSQHFRRLQEVHKFLRLWDSLSIPELIASLSGGCAPSAKPAFGQGELKKPNQSNAILLPQRIILGCSLLEALFPALRKAAAALSAQLALTFFVPLCLTGLAIMARMQVLAAQWVQDAVAAYNSLIEHVSTTPQQIGLPSVELPQMLKCQWAGRTPTVTQIPFPEGDSFSRRVQETVKLAQQQIRHPESKAALLELFGDDFDIGEKVERVPISRTGSAAPAALESARKHILAEAAQQSSPPQGPSIAVFEDREPGGMHVEAAEPPYERAVYAHSLAGAFVDPAGAAFHMQSGPQPLPQAMLPMHTAAVMSLPPQLQPDQESLWSAEEQASQGDGAFGAVSYVSGPVIMGPAAGHAEQQEELNTMRLSSSPEHLHSAVLDTLQQPAAGSLPVAVAEDTVADPAATSVKIQKLPGAAAAGARPERWSADVPAGASNLAAAAHEYLQLQDPLLGTALAEGPPAAATTSAALQSPGLAPLIPADVSLSSGALAASMPSAQAPVSKLVQAEAMPMLSTLAAGRADTGPDVVAGALSAVMRPLRDRRDAGTPTYISVDVPRRDHAATQDELSGTSTREPLAAGASLSTSRAETAHAAAPAGTAGPAAGSGLSGSLDEGLLGLTGQGAKRASGALLAPSKAQLKRARKAAAKQRSARDVQQTVGRERAWQDWLLHKPGGAGL